MKVRPGETRFRTSIYYVTDDAGKEHKVTATLLRDPERWHVVCHGCFERAMNDGTRCEHADCVRAPLEAKA